MTRQSRDERWNRGDLFDYGDPADLIERGHRVMHWEDRENNWARRDVEQIIARDARKAQIIARNRAAGRTRAPRRSR